MERATSGSPLRKKTPGQIQPTALMDRVPLLSKPITHQGFEAFFIQTRYIFCFCAMMS